MSAALLALTMSGCLSHAPVRDVPAAAHTSVELSATPFFPQREHQCGPAALATVLSASGVPVTPDALTDKVYVPELRGSLQLELIAAARGYDRVPYLPAGEFAALQAELNAGRPVLVLQNLGLSRWPIWHYAVVIGFDAGRNTVILRSGVTERHERSLKRFMREWNLAQRWAVVLLKPGEWPANPQPQRYMEAVAGLETAKRYDAALTAYRAAVQRWPEQTTARLGMGNVLYAQKQLPEAESAYRAVLEVDASHAIARNNLAQVLLERGKPQDALREIDQARAALKDPQFAALLEETRREILQALQR